jgi:fibronectin type 3 domain-containing protein
MKAGSRGWWLSLAAAILCLSGCGKKAPEAPSPKIHSVTLKWKPSPPPVTVYRIYRATSPGTTRMLLTTTKPAATEYTDLTVEPGRTYVYVITATNDSRKESRPTDPVTVTVPSP